MVKEVNIDKNIYVKWFSEIKKTDIGVAGGKGANLGEMYSNKFPVPPGFVITANAYSYFIEKSALKEKINEILNNLDIEDTKTLEKKAKEVRELIEKAEMPADLEEEIKDNYSVLDSDIDLMFASNTAKEILKRSRESIFVAVRSSATAEDLADASFAGQQETFLNVKGKTNLIEHVKKCMASLFTARAVYYRAKKGFGNDAKLAVVVQKMINSDKSGVMFTKNPVSHKDEIMIEAVFGLGEGIVSGMINPDNYIAEKNDLKIIDMKLGDKKIAIVRDSAGENKTVKLTPEKAKSQVLNPHELRSLANLAKRLEAHYGKPQDIEFSISGTDVYIVQSRPITTIFNDSAKKEMSGEILLSGLGASPGISSGVVKVVHSIEELSKIKKGDVLVTEMTNPDMVVDMQKANAIITDEGGITSHAAIVSREMGIPCVVGTDDATKKLHDGDIVTVDGFSGKIYLGKGEEKKVEIMPIVPTKTKIKVIVDIPDYAERAALSKAKAVGLIRLEGIIAESGKHPLYFVKNKKVMDYVNVINSGLDKIAEHFEEIWVRSSDLRSDEYSHLEGAPKEKEENPMLGDHGIRFSLKHQEILEAEILALKMLAEKHPEKIFGLMMPQVISLEELKKTKEIAKEIKFIGMKNAKLGIMVETPAAVQIINELCEEGIDFISFGTNDLTQYMLAIDRGNQEIQNLYSEMNPAVLSAISYVIRRCKKNKVETSICGQAASREDMATFLVKEGIDSISVNADAAYKISKLIAEIEKKGIRGEGVIEVDNQSKLMEKNDRKENKKIENETPEVQNAREVRIPVMNASGNTGIGDNLIKKELSRDMEQIILQELDGEKGKIETMEMEAGLITPKEKEIGEAIEEIEHASEDYSPGPHDNENKDIPRLNEAISVDSSQSDELDNAVANQLSDAKEFDLDSLIFENELKADKKLDIF